MKNRLTGNIALFLTALIWGLGFVAQRAGMEFIGPFTFNAVRSFLGALSLVPLILWFKYSKADTRTPVRKYVQRVGLAKAGILNPTQGQHLANYILNKAQQVLANQPKPDKVQPTSGLNDFVKEKPDFFNKFQCVSCSFIRICIFVWNVCSRRLYSLSCGFFLSSI